MSNNPGYVSNAELASRLSTLVDRWNRRENQMIALLTQEEGTVVVTDGLGNNHTLPSFPQLQKDVAGLTDELTGSVVQVRDLVTVATGMANAAQASADDASGFADAAEASAVRAAESAASIDDDVQATADAATFAAAKAAEAADSATEAASSAVDAAASATASATSALASAGSASQAGTSATAAGQARSDAQAAATAAATSRDQAQTILGYATDAADRAEADATAAAASAAAAADSATAAATSVTQATTQANRAEAQASAASTKAGEAAGLATTAAGHASAASGSASAASTSAQTASSAKTAAEAARDAANLYANAPQGTEVAPGEYSAKHWAAQAQAAATGSLIYMGSWDASTGVFPANPAKGHFYKVVGEGTVGGIHWRPGDQALYGAAWEKIDNTDQVTSVAGKQGDVSLVAGDIGGLGALATRNDVDFNTHVTGKPTTYPPSTHSHTKAQVGLDKVDNTADLDKPVSTATQAALDGKAAASHTHTIANVTGLQTALDGKAAASHTHTVANVTGLQAALDGKSAVGHTHNSTDIANIVNVTDDQSIGGIKTFVAGQMRLQGFGGNAKAGVVYLGSLDRYVYVPPSANSVEFRFADGAGGVASLNAGGTIWTTANFNPAGKADVGHTHTIANVTGLQGALDGKMGTGGGSFSGNVTAPNLIAGGSGNGAYVQVGDDVKLVDVGKSHTAAVQSTTNGNVGFLQFGTGKAIGWDGSNIVIDGNAVWYGGNFNPASKLDNRSELGWNCASLPGNDWNNATSNGWFMASGASNAPTGDWHIGTVLVHNGDWISQEIFSFTQFPTRRWKRQKLGGSWSNWNLMGEVVVSTTDPGGPDGTIWVQP
ncbi:hypothetical protein JAK45_18900 [Stenotrophomonas maltophilia]|nr:hypothetical protein [Stenotrophomonas maltophilia]